MDDLSTPSVRPMMSRACNNRVGMVMRVKWLARMADGFRHVYDGIDTVFQCILHHTLGTVGHESRHRPGHGREMIDQFLVGHRVGPAAGFEQVAGPLLTHVCDINTRPDVAAMIFGQQYKATINGDKKACIPLSGSSSGKYSNPTKPRYPGSSIARKTSR